jgi:molecular chaperone GrpE
VILDEKCVTDLAAAGPDEQSGPAREQIVIRNKRKHDTSGQSKGAARATTGEPDQSAGDLVQADETTRTGTRAEAMMGQPDTPNGVADSGPAGAGAADEAPGAAPSGTSPADPAPVDAEVVTGEVVADEPADTPAAAPGKAAPKPGLPSALSAELEALRSELDERLRDLQRVSAEYANYRKRVDRDRAAVVEQATGLVIAALLPILDDLDRARDHDDLVGPSAAMAEQLNATLAKFGLTGFGEVGDAFDPTRHEAVAHQTSAEVTEPTCVAVMRRGYLLGDRLLRAAMVAVADPE